MHVVIHTDGGSRGNPGPAAAAFTVHSPQNEVIHEEKRYVGVATNNVAEYTALVMAFEWLASEGKRAGVAKVDILMDSELIVKQMRGEYRIKDATLQTLAMRVKNLAKEINAVTSFIHVPRAKNARADELVNAALDAEVRHLSSTGN